MAQFAVAVFFPHTYFQLIFEELFRMNVPLLIPRHLSKHVYQPWFSTMARKWIVTRNMSFDNTVRHLHLRYNPWDPSSLGQDLQHSEYFCRPIGVRHFDSL